MAPFNDNVGPVPLNLDAGRWSMLRDDEPPTGSEYEEFLTALEGFVAGYFHDRGVHELPLYCQGDFFGERTEAIHITDPGGVPDDFFDDLSKWLRSSRWESWRIVFPTERDTVVYGEKIIRVSKQG